MISVKRAHTPVAPFAFPRGPRHHNASSHLVRDSGLPEPLTNEPFHAPDHGECRLDFHWPSQRLIVETDGWKAHGTRAAFESDRAKDAALTAAGYRVVRFTWLTDDATIVHRLKALLHH